jgi:hypothetical protein
MRRCGNNGNEQFTMLIAIVEPLENGKLVACWILSFVRLYLIKNLPQFLWHARLDVREAAGAITAGERPC